MPFMPNLLEFVTRTRKKSLPEILCSFQAPMSQNSRRSMIIWGCGVAVFFEIFPQIYIQLAVVRKIGSWNTSTTLPFFTSALNGTSALITLMMYGLFYVERREKGVFKHSGALSFHQFFGLLDKGKVYRTTSAQPNLQKSLELSTKPISSDVSNSTAIEMSRSSIQSDRFCIANENPDPGKRFVSLKSRETWVKKSKIIFLEAGIQRKICSCCFLHFFYIIITIERS